MTHDFDVVIAGGGPAGSSVAKLLRQKGRSVLVLERDRFPRFHIGESLLPMGTPILEALGVLDRVHAIGVVKRGADFPVDDDRYNVFRFDRTLQATAHIVAALRR